MSTSNDDAQAAGTSPSLLETIAGKIDSTLFLLSLILIWQASETFYNIHSVFRYVASPWVADLAAILFVFTLCTLTFFSFLNWYKVKSIQSRAYLIITSLFFVTLAAQELGILLYLKDATLPERGVSIFLRIFLKISFVYSLILFFWYTRKDAVSWKGYKNVYAIFAIVFFYYVAAVTGPGHITSGPKFAISAVQQPVVEAFKLNLSVQEINSRNERFDSDIEFFKKLDAYKPHKAAVYVGIYYELQDDLSAAEEWYKKASLDKNQDEDKSRAQDLDFPLNSEGQKKNQTPLEKYRRKALGGNSATLTLYAQLYEREMTSRGITTDIVFWHEQAAKFGSSESAQKIINYYWAGKFTPQDLTQSCQWMFKIEDVFIIKVRRTIMCNFLSLVQ
jgi:hypothetical protein